MTEFSNFSVIAFDENMPFFWAYRAVLFLAYYLMFLETIFKKIVCVMRKLLKSPFVKRLTRGRLARDSRLLSKIPKHLAFIVNEDDVSNLDVAKLIVWCVLMDINYISVYDGKGVCKKKKLLIEEQVEKVYEQYSPLKSSAIIEVISAGDVSRAPNGFHKATVELLSQEDGRPQIADVTRRLCHAVKEKAMDVGDITVSKIHEDLSMMSSSPDPDMALVFGSAPCTMGFLPWHLRLTEIYFTSMSHHCMDYENLLEHLHKFARTVQRVGK